MRNLKKGLGSIGILIVILILLPIIIGLIIIILPFATIGFIVYKISETYLEKKNLSIKENLYKDEKFLKFKLREKRISPNENE